jgi:hypothetical protein
MKRAPIVALSVLLLFTGAVLVLRERSRNHVAPPLPKQADQGGTGQAPAPRPQRESRIPVFIAVLSDPSLHESRQIATIRSLPDDLTQEEFVELMDLIRGPVPARRSARTWHVLINEIMNVLREPRFHIEGYGAAMAGMVADKQADPVLRDYAAQHLALSLDRIAHAPAKADFQLAMETFLKVCTSEDESFHGVTGTILMSLSALSETFHADDLKPYRDRLGPAIVALVSGDRESSMSNRISAIQAAGRLNFPQALPAIRNLASGGSPNRWVRLSSVAALGYYGRQEDRAYLSQLMAEDPAMSAAARTALESIDNRGAIHPR